MDHKNGLACSAGNHASGERVIWTGILSAKQLASAVSINWFVMCREIHGRHGMCECLLLAGHTLQVSSAF